MMRRYVTSAEARLLDLLDDLGAAATFAEALALAIKNDAAHPLTYAASVVEHASFATPVERGETPPPEPLKF